MKLFTKIAIVFAVCISSVAMAQMPHDAIYMPKKSFCVAVTASHSEWNQYWEGNLQRENLNLGTHTTQSIMPMVAIGITDKLNLIAALPYITTKASEGNLMGQKGIQDLSGFLKYKMVDKSGLSLHGVIGGSIPVGNYVPDFLPMSIGLQTKTATGRLIGNYQTKSGLYLQGHASYTYRSNIELDKDSYLYGNKFYNTNIVAIPNATDTRISVGYYKNGIQFEVFNEAIKCVGGDDIRRNDMPFPTNAMNSKVVGAYAKYQPKDLGFNLRYSSCYEGKNVGKNTMYSVGIMYNFKNKIKVAN
jgi:hypothetical protein